ncbi:mechanosensitive ion channel family protein [Methanolobus psychrotolerans]|uniref:mechanosensitive ion channel family protein n=1 Tax=Methanolobus psychrotolerans TaxID=1874706 RepID=UPI000B91B232|nr:mechanosensitive ion channel domain-containing protein [Methanolobus psychrotolerans]
MNGRNNFAILLFTIIILILSYFNYFTGYTENYEILLVKLIQASLIVLFAYLLDAFFENIIQKRVNDTRDRYTLKKASSIFITLLAAGLVLIVFLKETTTVIIAYGIFSAGVVIALQDVFRNFAGGIIILFSKSFRAGDRIQMGECYGDVLDIAYFHTTLMEIREWIDGDQYSGRILNVPNSFILNNTVKNYTKDFSFIWDEVTIILAPGSNWKKAKKIALDITNELIKDYVEHSKKELASMEQKYLLTSYDVETRVFMQIEGDRIEMHLRYVVDPKKRRHFNDMIVLSLLEVFVNDQDIIIGSISSVEVTKMPEVDIRSYSGT